MCREETITCLAIACAVVREGAVALPAAAVAVTFRGALNDSHWHHICFHAASEKGKDRQPLCEFGYLSRLPTLPIRISSHNVVFKCLVCAAISRTQPLALHTIGEPLALQWFSAECPRQVPVANVKCPLH